MSEDLNNILSGVEAKEPEAVEPEKAEPEKAEAEPVEQEKVEEPEKSEESADDTPKDIPYAVFKSTREDLRGQLEETRRELERVRASQQPKPEPEKAPDILENPEAYNTYVANQVNQAVTRTKLEQSRFFAEREFGKGEVEEAMGFFDQNPHLSHQFLNEPSPFHSAVEFVRKQKVANEIGNDPAAYKEKLKAEILKEIEADMAAKQAKAIAQKAAPSMANVNGSGGQRDPGWSGPTQLDGLIGQ